ncbi:MAG: hypothetical protein J1G02_02310 [Clostridiales bacterium]|nr:hypothetical protein [Clostridiales bacterium]
MKKATIIVIAAIYVASIVIVGVFGLKALIYNESNPITDIILPEQIEGSNIEPNTNGKGYYVLIRYREDLLIPIEYIPVPADSPSTIEVTITYQTGTEDEPTAELQHEVGYYLKFLQKGTVTISIQSTDNKKFSKQLDITAY